MFLPTQARLLNMTFFCFHRRLWAVMFFYPTDTCVFTVQVLVLSLALLFFGNFWFEVHFT